MQMHFEKELKIFECTYKENQPSYPKQETFSLRESCETETLEIINRFPKIKLLCLKISQ